MNLLLGGVDGDVPSIYFIDYLGTLQKMNYASHGYGSYILLSLFARLWKVRVRVLSGVEGHDQRGGISPVQELSGGDYGSFPDERLPLRDKDRVKGWC